MQRMSFMNEDKKLPDSIVVDRRADGGHEGAAASHLALPAFIPGLSIGLRILFNSCRVMHIEDGLRMCVNTSSIQSLQDVVSWAWYLHGIIQPAATPWALKVQKKRTKCKPLNLCLPVGGY